MMCEGLEGDLIVKSVTYLLTKPTDTLLQTSLLDFMSCSCFTGTSVLLSWNDMYICKVLGQPTRPTVKVRFAKTRALVQLCNCTVAMRRPSASGKDCADQIYKLKHVPLAKNTKCRPPWLLGYTWHGFTSWVQAARRRFNWDKGPNIWNIDRNLWTFDI